MSLSSPPPSSPPAPVSPEVRSPAPPRTLALVREGLRHGGGSLVVAAALFFLPWWLLLSVTIIGEELYPVDPETVGPLDGITLAAALCQSVGFPVFLALAALLGFGHRVGRPVGFGRALLGVLRRFPALLMWVLLCGAVPAVLLLGAAAPALLSGLSLPGIAVSAVLVLLCLPVLAAVYLSLPTAVLHGLPLGVGIRDSWRMAKGRRIRSLLVLLLSLSVTPLNALPTSLAPVLADDAVLGLLVATAAEIPLVLLLQPVAALMAASLAVPRTAQG
ncbi:hypothetical protein [Nocardiopsis sp. CC223A]|uniref:hypothetical protein n=1 Tax=Nocardiopsis sp. CC223A TaxID=3044051 RepID=UPI00278C5084|nr:hypothetical protein [Nocardiopsis sp. CC223A]